MLLIKNSAIALLTASTTFTCTSGFTIGNSAITDRHHQSTLDLHTTTSLLLSSTTAETETEEDFRINTTPPSTDNPLSPNTFAGQVEQAIVNKFGKEPIERILQSWRLLEQDYEHRQYVGDQIQHDNNNEQDDPATSLNYQHAHSYVPGLTCKPFWDTTSIPWSTKLAKNAKAIRTEFLSAMQNPTQLQNDGNNIWAGALTQEAGAYGEGWSTLVLMNRGMWDVTNCNLFPKTAKFVKDCGIPATEVFFASMKPNTEIKLHSDFTNFVLTSHLAVEIPNDGENMCRLSVGSETREWRNGEVMLFDTSIMHDAVNESDGMRYILMFRLWHPDLTDVEREALQHIYDCLEVPELLSEDPRERMEAEEKVLLLRTFPKLKRGNAGGFGAGGGGAGAKKTAAKKKKKKGKR